jgi:hypothetical protein
MQHIVESSHWWSGPEFLLKPEDQLPGNLIIDKGDIFDKLVTYPAPTTFIMINQTERTGGIDAGKLLPANKSAT